MILFYYFGIRNHALRMNQTQNPIQKEPPLLCDYCQMDPGNKPGSIVWNGFFDTDNQKVCCLKCRDFHYQAKANEGLKSLFSEMPIVINSKPMGGKTTNLKSVNSTTITIRDLGPKQLETLDLLKAEFGEKTYTKVFTTLLRRYFEDKKVRDELREKLILHKERYQDLKAIAVDAAYHQRQIVESLNIFNAVLSKHKED